MATVHVPSSSVPRDTDRSEGMELDWRSSMPGFWSATAGLGLAGSVERTSRGFEAHAATGEQLGAFPDLREAQECVAFTFLTSSRIDAELLAPRSTATIALIAVVSSIALAALVGAWLTSSL